MTAKTYGTARSSRKIVLLPTNSSHILYLDKKEIIPSQLMLARGFCLMPCDRELVEKGISELKKALDLIQ